MRTRMRTENDLLVFLLLKKVQKLYKNTVMFSLIANVLWTYFELIFLYTVIIFNWELVLKIDFYGIYLEGFF